MTPDEAVWRAVRHGDRKGTTWLSAGVVFARTGVRLSDVDVNAAVERLVGAGRLYWGGPVRRRRLLAGPEPGTAAVSVRNVDLTQIGLWE